MTSDLTLTDFILARIAEDEADPWRGAELMGADRVVGQAERDALAAEERAWEARVAAECEAKRRIVELAEAASNIEDDLTTEMGMGSARRASPNPTPYIGDQILGALALPYADRPGFDPAWRI